MTELAALPACGLTTTPDDQQCDITCRTLKGDDVRYVHCINYMRPEMHRLSCPRPKVGARCDVRMGPTDWILSDEENMEVVRSLAHCSQRSATGITDVKTGKIETEKELEDRKKANYMECLHKGQRLRRVNHFYAKCGVEPLEELYELRFQANGQPLKYQQWEQKTLQYNIAPRTEELFAEFTGYFHPRVYARWFQKTRPEQPPPMSIPITPSHSFEESKADDANIEYYNLGSDILDGYNDIYTQDSYIPYNKLYNQYENQNETYLIMVAGIVGSIVMCILCVVCFCVLSWIIGGCLCYIHDINKKRKRTEYEYVDIEAQT